jgi:hypothetical protein
MILKLQIVNLAKIRLEPWSNVVVLSPSKTQRALSDGVLRFVIAQNIIFELLDDASENLKIIL